MSPSRLGRPPRVSPAQIAEAALAIGLDRATIRNVAERLGMSVPGLYHHVRTREQLLAMAAAHGLGALELPDDRGRPLGVWLEEYTRFVHDALVAQPELIGQILAGTVNTMRQAQHLERFFAVLGTHGIGVAKAYAAYAQLMTAVTGAAATTIGHRAAADAGHRPMVDLRRAADAQDLPQVHELVRLRSGRGAPEPDPFAAVRIVIDAVVAERAEP